MRGKASGVKRSSIHRVLGRKDRLIDTCIGWRVVVMLGGKRGHHTQQLHTGFSFGVKLSLVFGSTRPNANGLRFDNDSDSTRLVVPAPKREKGVPCSRRKHKGSWSTLLRPATKTSTALPIGKVDAR